MIENRPGTASEICSSAGMKRRSFSITVTRAAPSLRRPRVKPPGPGPTSKNRGLGHVPAQPGDLRGQVEIQKVMLAKALVRTQTMFGDHLAQGR